MTTFTQAMDESKSKSKKAMLALLMASVALVPTFMSGAGVAEASTSPQSATFELGGGDLTLTAPDITSFGTVNLTPQAQTVTTGFTDTFGVSDARGTGEGWRLAVNSTQFEMVEPLAGFAPGTSAHALPAGSLTLKPLTAIERQGTAPGADPTSKMTLNSIIDSGAVTVANANVDEGMGDFKLSFEKDALGLVIDSATAKIDKVNYPDAPTPYEATVTWTLVTGP